MVKFIQVIDDGENCTFAFFSATDKQFRSVFPADGQDLQFSEDLSEEAFDALKSTWEKPVLKSKARGIHGTLFYGFAKKRHHFPISLREVDWNPLSINSAQRRLYASINSV
jgi:hypothetical protein